VDNIEGERRNKGIGGSAPSADEGFVSAFTFPKDSFTPTSYKEKLIKVNSHRRV
jgi:hypothetical protein